MALQIFLYLLYLYLWLDLYIINKRENRDTFKKDGITSQITKKYLGFLFLVSLGTYFILKLLGVIEYELKLF